MTTGEKIAKLRKEKGYTQEALADLLHVSRQSVSKWEQDLSFPETDNLILLSKLFGCSIDYLLNPNLEDESIKKEELKEDNELEKMIKDPQFFTTVWTLGYFILMAIAFTMTYASTKISYEFMFGDVYIHFNVYDFLFSSSKQFNNYVMIFGVLLMMLEVGVSLFMLFDKSNLKTCYKIRKLASVTEAVIWLYLLIILISNVAYGAFIILTLSIVNAAFIWFYKRHQYIENKIE
ncbi:helix-turn-helix domain-containing protein [Acholeplasma equifetale]|uniref:helix-turn-helix domain-containing protein n=1 Tax=Acholeplasma equifetale TaxID=264634 RepID=UPI00068C3A7E|nr:helix-turn-helix transcriptional regulator [Acholeplasma equifetale]